VGLAGWVLLRAHGSARLDCAVVALAYLLGGVPFGLLLGFVAGKDVRREGSGNTGATNVLRTCGPLYGLAALALDVLKGYGPVMVVLHLSEAGPHCAALTALAAVLGHNYPVWLGFKGGKGVATSAGVLLALSPAALGIGLGAFALIVAVGRYVSLGSIVGSAAMVVGHLFTTEAPLSRDALPVTALVALLLVLVLARHRDNIRRLRAGKEGKLGQSASARDADAAAEDGR